MNDERFEALVGAFGGKTVAVIGDYILDEYQIGETRRVSREAPVLVIDHLESVYHPGGAANAAQNVTALGGHAQAFGVLGSDREADELTGILDDRGVDCSGLIRDASGGTSLKTRIMAGDLHAQKQQIARIDRSHRVRDKTALGDIGARIIDHADAILFSDYNMGLVPGPLSDAVIEAARAKRVPVIVDTRFNLLKFHGATVATPNETELFEALRIRPNDDRSLPPLASELLAECDLGALIITRGSQGMFVYEAGGDSADIGIVGSQDAADVTGAGDTVAATVALSLASGATPIESAEMATYSAAIVVMKRGTATTTVDAVRDMRAAHGAPRASGGRL